MEISDFIQRFSSSRERQQKAIFNTLFIAGNKLQTLFDNHIPHITLKQFMLLSLVRQSPEPLTFTEAGNLLGCSRQNIKKLASALEAGDFVTIKKNPSDSRALCIHSTPKTEEYFTQKFAVHQKELSFLFEGYSDEEIQLFFQLLMKLYDGIENLRQNTIKEEDL